MTLDKNAMFEIIKKVEGEYSAPYYDSVGKVTLGVGFNIEDVQKPRNLVFVTLGIAEISGGKLQGKTLYNFDGTINEAATAKLATYFESLKNLIENDTYNGSPSKAALDAQSKVLNTNLNAIMSQIQSDLFLSNYKSSFHPSFSLTHSEIKNIFDSIIDTYSANVDKFLNSIGGSDKLAISSEMYQALVSLSYNGLSMTQSSMPGLADAIQNGNRAEAWFQIRYDTNKKYEAGVYKRRFFESEIFGVFAGSTPTEEEAKDFFKMMRFHEPKIKTINETDVVANANRDYGAGSAHAFDTFQKDALSKLTELYGQGIDIQNAIVGTDTINDNSSNRGKENINDILQGTEKSDLIFGEKGKDQLIGGAGKDVLYGGDDDDTLLANDGYGTADTDADYLSGGEGFDTYIAGKDDTINDSDGKGLINFNSIDLSGTKIKMKDAENIYEDDDFTYQEIEGKLLVINRNNGESITIDNWSEVVKDNGKTKEALGIILQESPDIVASVLNDDQAFEAEEKMLFNVGLDRELLSGEVVVVKIGYNRANYAYVPSGDKVWIPPRPIVTTRYRDSYTGEWHTMTSGGGGYWYQPTTRVLTGYTFIPYGEITFSEGEKEKIFTYTWKDDSWAEGNWSESFIPHIDEEKSHYAESVNVSTDRSGTGTIIDDDFREDERYDPLVLDTNKDGFISTTVLDESTTYFDITGDGLREKVGWVSPEDALLVYDKNEDGQISGINEVFGNLNQSGFDDLKQTIDSNHDNKIDRKDELFNQLQVWNDLNGDAKVQEGELRSLDEAGVKDIDLSLVETNIEINGNVITEASKYTTNEGTKELVADVELATDAKDVSIEIEDIPDFSVDESTKVLPQLNGSGLVYDAFIKYNTDPEFKALAMTYAQDLSKIQQNPEAFLESWSGYTQLMNELSERFSIENFTMNELDKKAWILDRFNATDKFKSDIEAYYVNSLTNGSKPSSPFVVSLADKNEVNEKYDVLQDRSESSFVILAHFQELFSDTHYDKESGKFVIDNEDAFNAKIVGYLNSDTNTIEDKLYLAEMMEKQHSGLLFNANAILEGIHNSIVEEFVKDVFSAKEFMFVGQDEVTKDGIIIGTNEEDMLNLGNINSKVLLGTGNDKVISGTGHNAFYFRLGDGEDVIYDAGGADSLIFDENITRDKVLIKLNRNRDLVIAIKEERKSFDELSDKVTIVDWMNSANRVEVITFGDGTTLKFKEVFELFHASDEAEIINLGIGNETIDAKSGNDVVQASGGNDTIIGGMGTDRLEGGIGNDTYIYSKGDGKDTIIDIAGHDTLQFTSEITADDLIAKYQGSDLLIGIKEAGKSFDELSDVITLKNYKNSSSAIEVIYFDGYQRVDIDEFLSMATEGNDVLELGDKNDTIDLLGGNDTVFAGKGDDSVKGGLGNDVIDGGEGDDSLEGGIGDDTLIGKEGNDTLLGGSGADLLKGGLGDDIYVFSRGDGTDTIHDDFSFGFNETQKLNGGVDTLRFAEGITNADIIYQYSGSDLIIALKEEGKSFEELSDVVTIKDYTNPNNKIENILLSDGSRVVIGEIKNGTNGNDTLDFKDTTEDMVLQGLSGTDFIHAGSGNDIIEGNTGLDNIYSGAGDDVMIGGSGDDFLAGGSGNDRYIFKRGDGNDVILDDNRPEYINFGMRNIRVRDLLAQMDAGGTVIEDAGVDTLEFGEGISREDISYSVLGNDLVITIAGAGGGSIIIVNHLLSENKIENILLSDGTSVDLFAATDGDDNLIFGNEDTTINALSGDDIVATGNGNDTITGGTGADTLKGGNGDDTYIFNKGNGKDSIEDISGVDTLRFGDGISQDDVIVRLIGRDLVIALTEEGKSFEELSDVITIKNHTNTANKLENISFADGTIVDVNMIALGTEENDNFIFGSANTVIDALDGDDIVATSYGNDTITGGKGADALKGGNGDDTYIFNKGDGKDSIEDTLGVDTLSFGDGILQNDVIVRLVGRDLVIALKEEGKSFEELSDVIIIKNHTNTDNKLENISFGDGTTLDVSTIALGTEGNDNFIFGSVNTTINALGGDDVVATGNGNDTITGGIGADTLKSGDGEDTLIGGSGNDTLLGGRENDTYIFNRGDGHDIIHDYVNGVDAWGGTISFEKNEATGKVIVNLTGGSLETTLRSIEREFYEVATNFSQTDGFKADEIFIKLVGDELIIAKFESGQFANWSNKIIFKQTVSDNGVYSYEEVEVQGNLDIEYLQDSLVFTTQAKNTEGETITSTLTFTQSLNAGNDTLKFGEGVSQDDIVFKFVGNDLILGLKEEGKTFDELSDTVTLKDYINSSNTIEHIVFNDGSIFNFDTTPMPTEGDDYLIFGNKSTTINLLGGNDIAVTGSGNDTILGGSGNDKLESGAGADYLEGGVGNDTLDGGLGNDTYVFNRGDGHDTINDDGGLDTLRFGSGIAQSDLLFKQEGDNLWIALKDADTSWDTLSDKILLKDWFSEKHNIESISLIDGTSLSATQIATMVLENQPDTLYSKHGAIMTGGFGDDTYVYKKDDFTVIVNDQFKNNEITVNAGHDTLKFEDINKTQITIGTKGNDLIIKIDAGHDTYTELKDYVVIRDWRDANRGIESIVFGDGETLNIDKTAEYPPLEFDENWITSRYYIYGSENNVIDGTDASEVIESGVGDDVISAKDGSDFITGGLGNDTIDGGTGNDTYAFNMSDGHDTLIDTQGVDTIKFGSGISRSDITITQVDSDLVMSLGVDGSVTLKDWFNEETIEHRIEQMVLENGGTIAIADFIITPTEQNDTLEYGDENNRIDALGGDDIIHIGGGDDVLYGNDGDDQLYGEEGNDVISGDKGVDTLYGAEGDDTYLFGRGDGKDTIIEDGFTDWGRTGKDTLKFKDGITPDDLIIIQSGDDLVVGLKEDGKSFEELSDTITLKKWSLYDDANSRDYSREYFAVEVFKFNDGTTWSMSDIIAHIGSDAPETIIGFNQADTLEGKKGNDTLYGHLGDDTYVFSRGDGQDVIYDYGRKGDDYSYYDAGNDTLRLGEGIGSDDFFVQKFEDSDDIVIYLFEEGKTFEELSDKVTIKDWFKTNNRIENLILSDGTQIDLVAYLNAGATEKNDKLVYGNGDDVVDALAGDDIIIASDGNDYVDGNTGNDKLEGNSGTDTLLGGNGDDTLIGGKDDDRLEGGEGSDTYLFNLGDGHDIISDYSTIDGEIDTITFGNDIDASNVQFTRNSANDKDLIITIDADNSITVENWFLEGEYKLEKLFFADGTILSIDDVENKVIYYGDANNNVMEGTDNSELAIYGFDGNDTITGNGGDESIDGGNGNDTYIFNRDSGRDIIIDSAGVDTIKFAAGITMNDIYIKQDGDTLLIALYEEGKSFYVINEGNTLRVASFVVMDPINNSEPFSNVISLQKADIEKISFEDGSSLDIKDIILEKIVSDEIFELDGLADVYTGSLNEDTSNTPHKFLINVDSLHVDSDKTKDVTVTIINEETGEYKLSGNFDALNEGEEAKVTFTYNVNYNADDTSLVSGVKTITLTVTGTAETSSENHAPIVTSFIKETLVNTTTQNSQVNPHIFALNNGAYIVAWISGNYYYGNENEGDVYIQAFNVDGEKIGNEQMIPYTSMPQFTALQDGGYVATWQSNGQDGSEFGVYLQKFDAGGEKVGIEQHVNTYIDGSQTNPQSTALQNGGYVIAWTSGSYDNGQDGSRDGVYLQRFDANGEKVGIEQQVNTYTDGYQSAPQITALQDGGYVVTWQSSEQDGSEYGIYLQRFSADGEKVGYEQQVNTYTNDYQDCPQIKALQDGGYVVTWQSYGQDGSGSGIYLQGFDANGEKVGIEQQVNTYTDGYQNVPQITALQDGGYVVTWQSGDYYNSQDGSGSGIYLQRFNANGGKVGVEQQVNTYTQSNQRYPQISALSDGGYVITWTSYGQDGSEFDVYLQRFDADGEKVGEVPQTNFFYTGQSLSGNLNYILDPDGDTLSYRAIVPENMSFSIDNTGHWEYYYGGSGEITITVDDGKGGTLNQTLAFVDSRPRPLVLDLNHNVLTSIPLYDSIAYFDYDGDGNREHTAWMEKGDAQLVVDLNHDGKINDGSEIFGEYTKLPDGSLAKNGYEALAQYDTNGDRVIDSKDEAFGNLSLWFDKNQNGKSEEGELVNIQLSQVTAIYLDRKNGVMFEQREEAGNIILNETTYKGVDGNGIIRDVGFAYDATDTITNNDTLDQKHYGSLLSGGDGDDTYLYSLGDGKIVINDNGDGQERICFGEDIIPEQLLVKWDKSTGDLIIGVRQSIYDPSSITEVSDQMHIQNWFAESGSIENFEFANGQSLTKESLYDLLLSTKEERSLTARVLEENGSIEGGKYSDLLYGTTGEEALYGNAGNDYLKGLEGDDLLQGGESNDILVGGEGDDSLEGGSGDDLYIYNSGDGRDFITDFLGKDTIAFGEGISKNDLICEIVGTTLVLGLKEKGKSFTELTNTITIENWKEPGFDIEYVEFYDGSTLSLDDLRNQAPTLQDTEVSVALKDIRESTGTINATDPDGDTLTYSVSTQAEHGRLYVNDNGEWVYKANDGYIGEDSAIVKVDDGNGGVVEQTLNFTLEVSAPTINITALSLLEDNSYSNTLSVTNPIGGMLTYEVVDATDHGVFVLNSDGTYSYNPSANYNGVDSVTLKVTNEYGLSTTQTIELNIASVNDIPTFESSEDEAYVLKNTRIVTGALNANDVDGDTLSYTLSTNPTHGTLTLDQTTGEWSYESLFGYIGSDSATISVSDGKGGVITKELTFASKGLVYEGGDLTLSAQTIGDTLELGSIGMDALSFTKTGNNLTITVKDQGMITISDYFTQTHQTLTTLSTSWGEINIGKEAIQQASGTWWWPFGNATAENGVDTLLIGTNYSDKLTGGSGNDVLVGSGNSDKLTGNAGNDLLIAGSGNDTLIGSVGSDTLYGDSGSDILDAKDGDDNLLGGSGADSLYGGKGADNLNGGGGNDYLRGDLGNDTYYFNLGDGKDTITDTTFSFCSWRGSVDGGDDTIRFGEGIDKEDVTFLMQCGNLSIKYGDEESVVIVGQGNDAGAIERFELSDGSFMTSDDVENIIQQMSAYAKDHGMHLSSISSIEKNADLMQIVSSGWHNA